MAEALREACPHWRHETLPSGGHMVPVTHPDLVNPLVVAWLDQRHGEQRGHFIHCRSEE